MTHTTRTSTGSPIRLGLGLASLVLAGLLLLGFKAPQDSALASRTTGGTGGTTGGTTGTTGGSTSGSGTTGSGTSGATGSGGSSSGTSGGSTAGGTVDGTLVETRYGPVQVEITVSNGKVTAVTAIALPSGGRSGMISGYAAPILSSEALSAQSASIDLVSGATYTSDAFAQSLQAALSQAGI